MNPTIASSGSHAERLISILPDRRTASSDRLRLLVIDRDPATAATLDVHLAAREAEVLSASTAAGARQVLSGAAASLILCDPAVAEDQHGFFAQLSHHAAMTGAGIVVLMGRDTRLPEADLYALGADACLTKPVAPVTLAALVRTRLRKIALDRSRMLEDPVTGLPNYAVFRDAYHRTALLAHREREPISLAVLHLDALREVRSVESGSVADEVLRRSAEAVRGTLRKSDLLARWEGDALLVLLPNTDRAGAERALEKVYHRLQRLALEAPGGGALRVALSAGIVQPDAQAPLEEAMEEALRRITPVMSAEDQALTGAAPPRSARERPRILLAEDDALTASIVQHRLERAGYEVLHVGDGAKVLSVAPGAGVSMMILDVKMPYVDGFEALRRLRSIRALRDVPVILLTSMGNEDDIVHGFELGADDYIVKPFSPVELLARVRRRIREAQPVAGASR